MGYYKYVDGAHAACHVEVGDTEDAGEQSLVKPDTVDPTPSKGGGDIPRKIDPRDFPR
jgi:hypothetical protein